MEDKKRKKTKLTATQVILLGFLAAILTGSVILSLPFCSASGEWTPWLNSLFTASTSVCVTGLVVVDTFSYWSIVGKIVILILIQLGGLGIISFTTGFLLVFRRKISLSGRILLESAFNLDSLGGLVKFLRKVFKGTLCVEAAGALLCLPVFVPQFGLKGIWISVFHSVSSFCNAGIDIICESSLIPYAANVYLMIVTMLLIIIGGIGFIVWWDVIDVTVKVKRGEIRRARLLQSLSLHSKITLTTTLVLILGGGLLFSIFEWNNPDTLGQYGFGTRILGGLFQSVTTRTAGFAAIDQGSMKPASVMVSIVLMFIGGSSVSTAGGVKTSTIALVALSTFTVIKGRERVTAFKRTIPKDLIQRALAIVTISITAVFAAAVLLSIFEGSTFSDSLFETASALGTAGLSCGLSAHLTPVSKVLLSICMYLGRVGPISLATAFARASKEDMIKYPERDITIG